MEENIFGAVEKKNPNSLLHEWKNEWLNEWILNYVAQLCKSLNWKRRNVIEKSVMRFLAIYHPSFWNCLKLPFSASVTRNFMQSRSLNENNWINFNINVNLNKVWKKKQNCWKQNLITRWELHEWATENEKVCFKIWYAPGMEVNERMREFKLKTLHNFQAIKRMQYRSWKMKNSWIFTYRYLVMINVS